jgi:serine/threonine protein phosphatase PrpC
MAYVAAATEVGSRKQVNEDSCCIKVAQTSLGEVIMALVCDGVGGLSAGNLASATVVNRFSQWFEQELPMLMEGMVANGSFDFQTIKAVWGALLQTQNELIRTHGTKTGIRLGTTFTGIITCGGRYLVGHVGDCRAYQLDKTSFKQITEDQTEVARKLAAGEITAEEARRMPKNVILQAVGSGCVLVPAFYEGTCGPNELFVICCDGAYHRSENEGIRQIFQRTRFTEEQSLDKACHDLLDYDLQMGEKDNLTVVCFSLAESDEAVVVQAPVVAPVEDDLPTMVEGDEDDLPTMVEADESLEDDLPTMVEPAISDEDDLPTMVKPAGSDEDDLPTMVGSSESDEDDLPTMIESSNSDEDDLPTMVEVEEDEDDLPTMVEPTESDEDDLPTMVEAATSDEDDLPTMVEGADA